MRPIRTTLALAATASMTAAALIGLNTAAGASVSVKITPLHFKVQTGPTGSQTCDIIGDLYTPSNATSKKRVPALLTTNGFGGSKDDQAGIGKAFAKRGYTILSYSGLGFGGSGCKITLDDPDFDGLAASQLVSYLGGKSGIAFTDAKHTKAAPKLNVVTLDHKDHHGKASKNDPRVGMVGGSYGGQIQFAAASVDPRIDTIVPIVTWSDLSYSLSPNNTSQTSGVQTSTPGAAKIVWALGFSALGVLNGLENVQTDPARLIGCPNFATFVCPALVNAAVTGTLNPTATAALRHASVSNYTKKVTIPTLLVQGQNDTLFNLNEAVANYRALKKQGTTVKMLWQNWGHSDQAPAPGEIDLGAPNPATQYETRRISDWFDHYLKGAHTSTGPAFSYFRDWVKYSGIATPAYGTSSSFPVGSATKYYLSGTALTKSKPAAGTQTFLTPVAGLPTSTDPVDVVGSFLPLPEIDLPGTTASWSSGVLTKNLHVVGSPKLTLKVGAPAAALTQAAGPTGQLVLFAKLVDVDAAGKSTIVRNLVAPIRVPDVNKPFTVTMPGIVHRFAKGHTLRLVVAGGSTNYRGGLVPNPVTITTGSTSQVLTLPVVD
jgi:ABC-2 type transport system ATP-binding protein